MEGKMIKRKVFMLFIVAGFMVLASCRSNQPKPAPEQAIPNPASVFCSKNGGTLELRQDAAGGVAGVCVFTDGSECDEWAYFRGECMPGDSLSTPSPIVLPEVTEPSPTTSVEIASDGWKVYRNEELGYSFHFPADTKIISNDEPLKSISIIPEKAGAQWPSIGISHPGDREDFRPPEGTDLPKWLADHYLVGDKRAPDVQIAGTTAIHFRQERSPQSYAMDRYFFANKGQLFMIIIGHTDDVEDWGLYNQFLESFQFDKTK
jgi:putative hemolysin